MPAVRKVTWNVPPGALIPESNAPSGAPGEPDVTECGSPEKVQRTTSPMCTDREPGWKLKLAAATVMVAAFASNDPATSRSSPAIEATAIVVRRFAPCLVGTSVIDG